MSGDQKERAIDCLFIFWLMTPMWLFGFTIAFYTLKYISMGVLTFWLLANIFWMVFEYIKKGTAGSPW